MSFLGSFLEKNKNIIQTARFWVSLALVVLILVFSFSPVFTLNTVDVDTDVIREVEAMTDGEIEYSAKVGVTPVKVVKSVLLVSDAIKLIADEDMTTEERTAIEEKMDDAESVECLILMSAILNTATMDGNALMGVLMLVSVLALVVMTVVIPVMAVIGLVKALIGCFVKKNNRHAMASSMSKGVSSFLIFAIIIIVLKSIVPGLDLGAGVIGILVCSVISLLISLITSRLVPYSKDAAKFLNVAQITALISLIGMIIAICSTMAMNVIPRFSEQSQNYTNALNGKGMVVAVYLIILFYVFMVMLVSHAGPFIDRLTCSVKKGGKKRSRKDGLVSLILAAVIVIGIPTYLGTCDGGKMFRLQLDTYQAYSEEDVNAAEAEIKDLTKEGQEKLAAATSFSEAEKITTEYAELIAQQQYIIALNASYKAEGEKLELLETILPELTEKEDIEQCEAEIAAIKTNENGAKATAIVGFVIAIAGEIIYKMLSKTACHKLSKEEKDSIIMGTYELEAPTEDAPAEEAAPVEE